MAYAIMNYVVMTYVATALQGARSRAEFAAGVQERTRKVFVLLGAVEGLDYWQRLHCPGIQLNPMQLQFV